MKNFETTWKTRIWKSFLFSSTDSRRGNIPMANWNSNERLVMNNLTFKYFCLRSKLSLLFFPLATPTRMSRAIHFLLVLRACYNLNTGGRVSGGICRGGAASISTFLPLARAPPLTTYPRKLKGKNAGKMKNGYRMVAELTLVSSTVFEIL